MTKWVVSSVQLRFYTVYRVLCQEVNFSFIVLSGNIPTCILVHSNRVIGTMYIFCIYLPSQNGILSALPYFTMWIMMNVGGQVADYLRFNHILHTTSVRKLATGLGRLYAALTSAADSWSNFCRGQSKK